eukprot:TRINITY_DN12542_c0_g1_i10.p1 TRINITY_DN12542_c0_g1~~TRINITY_DN12542_c0_g1_i10.p1  ORF type:complete len:1318 (+),score=236.69 TRINITY_DN12542_c0_g1_i10:74-4027(+)
MDHRLYSSLENSDVIGRRLEELRDNQHRERLQQQARAQVLEQTKDLKRLEISQLQHEKNKQLDTIEEQRRLVEAKLAAARERASSTRVALNAAFGSPPPSSHPSRVSTRSSARSRATTGNGEPDRNQEACTDQSPQRQLPAASTENESLLRRLEQLEARAIMANAAPSAQPMSYPAYAPLPPSLTQPAAASGPTAQEIQEAVRHELQSYVEELKSAALPRPPTQESVLAQPSPDQREHLEALQKLQQQLEKLKIESELKRLETEMQAMQPQESSAVQLATAIPTTPTQQQADVKTDSAYEASKGLVIYFDFLDLYPRHMPACKLRYQIVCGTKTEAAAQYCTMSESGRSSKDTVLFHIDPHYLVIKSCPANALRHLLIEIFDAASGQVLAWTKLFLFDNKGQLGSGRWRLTAYTPLVDLATQSIELLTRTPFFNSVLCVRLIPACLHGLHEAAPRQLRQQYLPHGLIGCDVLAQLQVQRKEVRRKASIRRASAQSAAPDSRSSSSNTRASSAHSSKPPRAASARSLLSQASSIQSEMSRRSRPDSLPSRLPRANQAASRASTSVTDASKCVQLQLTIQRLEGVRVPAQCRAQFGCFAAQQVDEDSANFGISDDPNYAWRPEMCTLSELPITGTFTVPATKTKVLLLLAFCYPPTSRKGSAVSSPDSVNGEGAVKARIEMIGWTAQSVESLIAAHKQQVNQGHDYTEAYWTICSTPIQPFAHSDKDLLGDTGDKSTASMLNAIGGVELRLRLLSPGPSTQSIVTDSSSDVGQSADEISALACHRPASSVDIAGLSQDDYILNEGSLPEPDYQPEQGAMLYIDGAKILPFNAAVSKVVGRIYSRGREVLVDRIDTGTSLVLDSDMSNPVYDYRLEIDEEDLDPTAILITKLNVVDTTTQTLSTLGYIALNLFCEPGTREPILDTDAEDFVLNDGAHQVPIFSFMPGDEELDMQCFDTVPRVPCSTLLIRLLPRPLNDHGEAVSTANVPEDEWQEQGLVEPISAYTTGVYRSILAKPTTAECSLLKSRISKVRPAREYLEAVALQNRRQVTSDRVLESILRGLLKKSVKALDHLNLGFYAPLSPEYEVGVALVEGHNLPKKKIPLALAAIVPSCKRYHSDPTWRFSELQHTTSLQTEQSSCTFACPKFGQELLLFRPNPAQLSHNAMLVIDLRYVEKRQLKPYAHAFLPMFQDKDHHVTFGTFELQCYQGTPNPGMMTFLEDNADVAAEELLSKAVELKHIKAIDGATLTVQVHDFRLAPELLKSVKTRDAGFINKGKRYHADDKTKHVSTGLGKLTWQDWRTRCEDLLQAFVEPSESSA